MISKGLKKYLPVNLTRIGSMMSCRRQIFILPINKIFIIKCLAIKNAKRNEAKARPRRFVPECGNRCVIQSKIGLVFNHNLSTTLKRRPAMTAADTPFIKSAIVDK